MAKSKGKSVTVTITVDDEPVVAKATAKKPVYALFILDKSGSMGSIADDVCGGFNQYKRELIKKSEIDYSFNLVQFDRNHGEVSLEWTCRESPLSEVPDLSRENFRPRGDTPLVESVIRLLRENEYQVSSDQSALVIVMTDGQENSSRVAEGYTTAALQELVTRLQNKGNWTFVFLGANMDSWGTARNYGYAYQNTMDWAATPIGTRKAFENLTGASARYSANAASGALGTVYASNDFFSEVKEEKEDEESNKVAVPA